MRIAAISDLHLGKTNSDGTPFRDIPKILEGLARTESDVVTITGDIADSGMTLDDLKEFFGAVRVAAGDRPVYVVPGNNDLEWVAVAGHNIPEIAQELSLYGAEVAWMRLVDLLLPQPRQDAPIITEMGFYDGTLWQSLEEAADAIPADQDPTNGKFPATHEESVAAMRKWYEKEECGPLFRFRRGVTQPSPEAETAVRWARLIERVEDARVAPQVVLTHYIPCRGFVSSKTAKFRYLNTFMGANREGDLATLAGLGVRVVLCGHTHRHHEVELGGLRVINVSGPNQPTLIEV